MTTPVVTTVSHATRPNGSCSMIASRTASESWSASLSGWPSVTDSEVKRYRRPKLLTAPQSAASAASLGQRAPETPQHFARTAAPLDPIFLASPSQFAAFGGVLRPGAPQIPSLSSDCCAPGPHP